jgi:hypothetical protein
MLRAVPASAGFSATSGGPARHRDWLPNGRHEIRALRHCWGSSEVDCLQHGTNPRPPPSPSMQRAEAVAGRPTCGVRG